MELGPVVSLEELLPQLSRWPKGMGRDPEKIRAQQRRTYRKHRTRRLEKTHRNYLQNKDRIRQNNRAAVIRHTYGLSLKEYEDRLSRQQSKCAICLVLISRTAKGNNRACLDHDHKTNSIRSFLCHRCNVLLGMAEDSPDRLLRAVDYLQNFKVNNGSSE